MSFTAAFAEKDDDLIVLVCVAIPPPPPAIFGIVTPLPISMWWFLVVVVNCDEGEGTGNEEEILDEEELELDDSRFLSL